MRRSFPPALSRAAASAVFLAAGVVFLAAGVVFLAAGVVFHAAHEGPSPDDPQAGVTATAGPQSGAANTPAQFPPRGTGVALEERGRLQSAVDQLAMKVATLKHTYQSGAMADRVADVEVYLDAVRRPLKYDERLYAPKGSTPLATALQTLATGNERAEQLSRGTTPWMTASGVRGFATPRSSSLPRGSSMRPGN